MKLNNLGLSNSSTEHFSRMAYLNCNAEKFSMAAAEDEAEAAIGFASLFIIVMELCVSSLRASGLIEMLVINCTFPSDCTVDLEVFACAVAGLNVLQPEAKQTINVMGMRFFNIL